MNFNMIIPFYRQNSYMIEKNICPSIVIRNSIPSIPDKRYTLIMYDVKEGYGFSLTNDETDWIVGLIFVIL